MDASTRASVPKLEEDSSLISDALRYMMNKNGISVPELSEKTGIKRASLYSMLNRNSTKCDMNILKVLSDYFDEDIAIFCGLDGYERVGKLSENERNLLNQYRSLTDMAQERVHDFMQDILANSKNLKSGKLKKSG